MTKNYLTLFWLSLIGIIIFAVILIFLIVFSKKIILSKKYGMILLFFISLVICTLSVSKFILCCKDYKYFSTGTYIEVTGTVVDYMDIKRDYDGNGEVVYRKPKFFIVETGEYIVLNTKEVSKGKKYIIKYYPNTKICEVTEYMEILP